MSDIAIKVEKLSKAYRIGLKEQKHDTLGAALVSWIKSPLVNFRRLRSLSHFDNYDDPDVLWALKDVSFEVKKGEVLGIIGKNGAGKSTLLKLLARVTEPTYGRAEIYGRVASLLEVGTGFNPELTGRENIYLNGTILGMTKKEIDRKLDEIVDFSGVEKFLDTPVKRYSSGMRVRLAFAVAAHLDPEILIIDEVLAVGDAEFQKKCLGKMEDVATQEGRTVLFVSHDMGAVESLCPKTMLLKSGQIKVKGCSEAVIKTYLNTETSRHFEPVRLSGGLILKRLQIGSERAQGVVSKNLSNDGQNVAYITIENNEDQTYALIVGFTFISEKGDRVFNLRNTSPLEIIPGFNKIKVVFETPNLLTHRYRIDVGFKYANGGVIKLLKNLMVVDLIHSNKNIDYQAVQKGNILFVESHWDLLSY